MKEPFILKENLLFIESWMNKNENLIAGFTTIKGGTSIDKFEGLNIAYHVGDEPEAVLKNRQVVADAIEMPLEKWVFAEQMHTTAVHKVTSIRACQKRRRPFYQPPYPMVLAGFASCSCSSPALVLVSVFRRLRPLMRRSASVFLIVGARRPKL